jgi:hypothetical protein
MSDIGTSKNIQIVLATDIPDIFFGMVEIDEIYLGGV